MHMTRRWYPMPRARAVLAATVIAAGLAAGSAVSAEGVMKVASDVAPPDVPIPEVQVDPRTVASGHRASWVVGGDVVSDAGEVVARIDDLIVLSTAEEPVAVLTVGWDSDEPARHVLVPLSALRIYEKRMLLPGVTREHLRSLPEFNYKTEDF